MKAESFGKFIRRLREENCLPLRKVAAKLDIDTSTLSKVEREERALTKEHLKPLAEIFNIELKEIQVRFIADTINKELGQLEFVMEGLKESEKQIKKEKK
jgi:transcriptional regulator with XRE-family HTH domain